MIIKEITIKNFRSFKGETTLDLNINKDKNVVLIGGQNGSGKSSLFEAVKLCIYGPLAFGYKGMVSQYIQRIKASINSEIFEKNDVESFVELKLSLNMDAIEEIYTIRRTWTFNKGVLVEKFTVNVGNKTIEGEEKDYFIEYINSLIPPSVFDLFLFDGERIFDFFSDKNINNKLKKIVLTLNNLDVFDFLSREMVLNNRRNLKKTEEIKKYMDDISKVEKEIKNIESEIENLEIDLEKNKNKYEKIQIEIRNLEEEFSKSGGLKKEQRKNLIKSMKYYEVERELLNQKIKDFSNELLPFIILKEDLEYLREQIKLEDEFVAYEKIKNNLDLDIMREILENRSPSKSEYLRTDENIELILNDILNQVTSYEFSNNFAPIHNLSYEQKNLINYKINEVLSINNKDLDPFLEKEKISKRLSNIRLVLRSSLSEEDENKFILNKKDLEKELNSININILKINNLLDSNYENREKLYKNLERLNAIALDYSRGNQVVETSNKLVDFINNLLDNLLYNKIIEIEKEFNFMFNQILRKKGFIDYIKIDKNFNIDMYLKTNYRYKDLYMILSNLSMKDIEANYGKEFIRELSTKLGSTKRNDLLKIIKKEDSQKVINLSTKSNSNNFSSGEKQIYILSLYWALIKTSNINIPFIIDTPYGRIDTIHREAITKKYFPNISNQVIILSTNTEVNKGLYKKLKGNISKEYLLNYDVSNRKTMVEEGYFFEVI